MKRLITAIVLIIVITVLCIGLNILVARQVGEVRRMVNDCKELMAKKDIAQAQKTADALVKLWERREALLSPFINHEKIDEITLAVTNLAANIKAGNEAVFLSDAEKILTLLHQLGEDERISLHSIF